VVICAIGAFVAGGASTRPRPDRLVLFMLSAGYGVGFALPSIFGAASERVRELMLPVGDQAMLASLCYSYWGFAALVIVYWAGEQSVAGKLLGERVWRGKVVPRGLLAVLAIAGSLAAIARAMLYGSVKWSEAFPYVGTLPGHLAALGFVAAWSLLLDQRSRGHWSLKMLAIAGLAAHALGGLLYGHRGAIVQVLAVPVMFVFLLRPRHVSRTAKATLAFLSVLFLCLFPRMFVALATFKGLFRPDYRGSTADILRSAAVTLHETLAEAAPMPSDFLPRVNARLSAPLQHFALTIEKTPDLWDFQHGRTLVLVVYTFIPHLVWHGKPPTSMDGQFYQDYLGYLPGPRGGGASPSTFGDLYLNFGVVGVLIGATVLGFLLRVFQNFVIPSASGFSSWIPTLFFIDRLLDIAQLYSSLSNLFGNALLYGGLWTAIFIFLGRSVIFDRGRVARQISIGGRTSRL